MTRAHDDVDSKDEYRLSGTSPAIEGAVLLR